LPDAKSAAAAPDVAHPAHARVNLVSGGDVHSKPLVIVSILLLANLGGCSKKASTAGQNATLALKDGTTVTGTVTKSDTSSITIQTPTGVVSTYPVSQVASVNYGPGPGAASNPPAPVSAPQPAPPDASTAPSQAAAPPPAPPEPAETFRTIPAGTTLSVRTSQTIDSKNAQAGQTYPGVVARSIVDDSGRVAIPRGSDATLVVRDAREQGKFQGRSELVLDVAEVRVNGHRYRLETSAFVEKGKQGVGTNKRTAEFAGGGSLLGGIIGAVAGGGRGAAIGALSGAAGGAVAQSATRGKNVRLPAESLLNFRLEAPIHIRELQ
jgi:outer membrane lipoprotein SlyB